jgi:transcriptional regulator with XRE-family HTH domain
MARTTTIPSGTNGTWPSVTDFGNRIRAERERLKLTPESAATQLGISTASYSRMEKETSLPGSLLAQLVRGLGMRLRCLVPEAVATPARPTATSKRATAKPTAIAKKKSAPAAAATRSRAKASAR